MATYKKYATKNNTPIQVQSAIEDGVGKNIQNNYAKQDGYYNKLTSGYSENLTPYSSESGVTQNIPFNFQGTGCGNGTAQVDTGSYGIIKNKRGFGLNVNQLANYTNISAYAYTTSGNTITVAHRPSDFNAGAYKVAATVTGHKYFINIISDTNKIGLYNYHLGTSQIATAGTPMIYTESYGYDIMLGYASDLANGTYGLQIALVDLTRMFGGTDLIPADLLAHPENFYRYYSGSLAYRTGGMLFSQGRYLKTYGRNQWDEEWVKGYIVDAGNIDGGYNNISSKNYIRVVPNTTYHILTSYSIAGQSIRIAWYDADKNLIEVRNRYSATPTAPANAMYMRFSLHTSYGITYKHDTTISLYYVGESGYNDYYPHEELDIIDTGNENLLWARNSADEKLDNGTIIHNNGAINLGDRDWALVEGDGYWYWASISPTGSKAFASDSIGNISCDNYLPVKMNDGGFADNTIAMDNTVIVVRTNSTSTEPSGMVYFELATPTTEQGTEYESKVDINDFGSMSLESANGIPQGIEIFYPVDYKAFVDTLYNHTDGDATNLVIQSDLEAEDDKVDELYAIYKANMGGTLRQLLAITNNIDFSNTEWIDLGTLNWVKFSDGRFYVSGFSSDNTKRNCLCSKYVTDYSTVGITDQANGTIQMRGDLKVVDTSFTSADTFKAAMKGVLLAYEKA